MLIFMGNELVTQIALSGKCSPLEQTSHTTKPLLSFLVKKMDERLRGRNMLSAVCAKASCSLSSRGLDLAARDLVNEVDT